MASSDESGETPQSPGTCVPGDNQSLDENYQFEICSFPGGLESLLYLKSQIPEFELSSEYLDWRYQQGSTLRQADLLFVKDSEHNAVGMLGLVYRQFYVNGQAVDVAIRGDMMITPSMRGKGLATALYRHSTLHMQNLGVDASIGMIASSQAARAAVSAGFSLCTLMLPYVFVMDPLDMFEGLLGVFAARFVAAGWQKLMGLVLSRSADKRYVCSEVEGFDGDFDELWERSLTKEAFLHERSASSLHWRYRQHPAKQYRIVKVHKDSFFVGYAILHVSRNRVAFVDDMLVEPEADTKPALNAFLHWVHISTEAKRVRLLTTQNSALARVAAKLWFWRRAPEMKLLTWGKHAAPSLSEKGHFCAGDNDNP